MSTLLLGGRNRAGHVLHDIRITCANQYRIAHAQIDHHTHTGAHNRSKAEAAANMTAAEA